MNDPSPSGARLDFLEAFRSDLAQGRPGDLAAYARRFPELGAWLEVEYARLIEELRRSDPAREGLDLAPVTLAQLLEHLRGKHDLGRRYARVGELGRGGSGRVWRVLDRELGRELAMKVLEQRGERAVQRFLREARITGRLEHPGILPVHELGFDSDGEACFTMRVARGTSFKLLLERLAAGADERLLRQTIEVLLKVADTIAFAHSRGVIHRDLKPGNVMVGDFGEVVVVDWGLARELGSEDTALDAEPVPADDLLSPLVTLEGDVLGTPAYMPPEQAEGRQDAIGRHSDVYALGAMLYQALARRPPFIDSGPSPTSREVLERVRRGPPVPLATLAPRAPPELVSIARRAMAREPRDRYADGAAFAADLRAYLEQRIVAAHAHGPVRRLRKWVRRNRSLSAALAGLLVATLASLVIWREVQAKERDLGLLANLRGPLELRTEFDTLWPADEAHRPALVSWLQRAEALRAGAQRYELQLGRLRASGARVEQAAWVQEAEERRHERDLATARQALERTRVMRNLVERGVAPAGAPPLAVLDANVASLERECVMVEARVPARITWQFVDPQTQLLHDRIEQFLCELDLVCGRSEPTPELKLVRTALGRLDASRASSAGDAKALWAALGERLAAHPLYQGLSLPPQAGLVPLGPDPVSGLEEFAHALSGEIPTRDAEGHLERKADSALVLALIPGGTSHLGSQAVDPAQPSFDPAARSDEGPPLRVEVEPFFLAKTELTLGQWLRLTGLELAEYTPTTPEQFAEVWLLPAFGMTATMARTILGAYDLQLPTSLTWEHAARAGTDTPWWTGSDPDSLEGAANVADASFQASSGHADSDVAGPVDFDDGQAGMSVVASYRPNAYGLFDTAGNVAEWCRDRTEPRIFSTVADLELYPRAWGLQIVRGGSAQDGAENARSAARLYVQPEFRSMWIGVRPARSVALAPNAR